MRRLLLSYLILPLLFAGVYTFTTGSCGGPYGMRCDQAYLLFLSTIYVTQFMFGVAILEFLKCKGAANLVSAVLFCLIFSPVGVIMFGLVGDAGHFDKALDMGWVYLTAITEDGVAAVHWAGTSVFMGLSFWLAALRKNPYFILANAE